MKNIKTLSPKAIITKLKKTKHSPYYTAIVKIFAVATLITVGLTLLNAVSLPFITTFGDNRMPYAITSWTFTLANAVTLLGGFGASWLLSRSSPATRNERIIKAGAYGLLAQSLYMATFSYFLQFSFALTGQITPYLAPVGPLAAVLIVAIVAFLDRRGTPFLRTTTGLFVVTFWGIQLWSLVQSIISASRSYPTTTASDYWVSMLLFTLLPIIIAAAIFFALRPIGKLARAFFATYTLSLAYTVILTLFSFNYSPQMSPVLTTLVPFIGLSGVVAIVILLVRARRLKK